MLSTAHIIKYRLISQQLCGSSIKTAKEMVAWFGAIQGQEYAQTKWGIGLRLPQLTDIDIEDELLNGKILRTHLLRPTWHFIAREDIDWLLKLTAPRVHAANAFMYRKLELETSIFNKCNRIIRNALNGNKQLTRDELNDEFKKNKIKADGLRLIYIMMYAELEGVICSGKRHGKKFTYALLEDIIDKPEIFNKEEALAEIAIRYFQSRGPATVNDFSTWSGLTIKECRQAIEMNMPGLEKMIFEKSNYYFLPTEITNKTIAPAIQLLPIYDEYIMGYKNRNAMLAFKNTSAPKHPFYFDCMIIDKGNIAGTWKRVIEKKQVDVYYDLFKPFNKRQQKEFESALGRFGKFNNSEVIAVPKI